MTEPLYNSNYDSNEYEYMRTEEAALEVFQSKEFSDMFTNILGSIDNFIIKNKENEEKEVTQLILSTSPNKKSILIPKLTSESEILTDRQLSELYMSLPYYMQLKNNFTLLYSTNKHGISMKNFYQKAENHKNTILLIKDDSENVFGVYCTEQLKIGNHFYGSGESFLFSFYKTEKIHCFHTTGYNDHFMYSDEKILAFGCSDNYFSLNIQDDFLNGYSKTTQTFNNAMLSDKEKFFISKLELWQID